MRRNVPSTAMRHFQRYCLQWLLLVAAVLGQGRIAEATCGDYLEKHSPQTARIAGDGSAMDRPAAPRQPVNSPVCQGPNCRRHEPIPAKPSNELATPTVMEATLTRAPVLVALEKSNAEQAFQTAAISGPPGRVFRPPRMA